MSPDRRMARSSPGLGRIDLLIRTAKPQAAASHVAERARAIHPGLTESLRWPWDYSSLVAGLERGVTASRSID